MGQQFAKSCPRHDRILYKPQGVHELDNIDLRKLKKLIKVSSAGARTVPKYVDGKTSIVLTRCRCPQARRLAPFWKQKDDCQDGREVPQPSKHQHSN